MLRTIIKFSSFLGLLLIIQTTSAQIVELECPDIHTLTFNQINNQQFQINGVLIETKGNIPSITLSGITAAQKADAFVGVIYTPHLLSCLYFGASFTDTDIPFTIKNNQNINLEFCSFPNTVGSECKGDYQFCKLTCFAP